MIIGQEKPLVKVAPAFFATGDTYLQLPTHVCFSSTIAYSGISSSELYFRSTGDFRSRDLPATRSTNQFSITSPVSNRSLSATSASGLLIDRSTSGHVTECTGRPGARSVRRAVHEVAAAARKRRRKRRSTTQ